MNKIELEKIVNYIVEQGVKAIKEYTNENQASIDYVSIFAKDENEFQNLELVVEAMGVKIERENMKTGKTYLLNQPIETIAGNLRFVRIRIPDPTRPQRGAPDFKVQNYHEFKEKYLQSSGNFTLMLRKDFEMVGLKGVDVLVYFPDVTLGEELAAKD